MQPKSIPLEQINIQDPFWSKHIDLVKDVIIPYQWEAMNDRIEDAESSHCIENFKIAAKEAEGAFYGAVFQDTDVAKWLEAVGFSLATHKDEALEKMADEVIETIGKAQCEDGYLNTYFTLKAPEDRWTDLCEGHELYTAGHMMEAAVAYYKGTGKKRFLEIVMKFADLICETFGSEAGKIHGYPGHQEVEIGLIKLYEVTGNQRYLEMAKYFIDTRGVGENYFLKEMARPGYQYIFPEFKDYDPRYSQSHLPVREQETAEGHAVRAVYMYCAMADLAKYCKDESLYKACMKLWDNIVTKRMYITGGIGSSGILERFTTDYDLPNEYNYSESCASIGLALFGLRMAQMTKDATFIDVVERALYNTVLAGIALDGKGFFYVNPLEVWPEACIHRTSKEHVKPIRQKWFGVACCPPNIARTLASLGQYIYTVEERTLFVQLFISNDTCIPLENENLRVQLTTCFPQDNSYTLHIAKPNAPIKVALRVPDYAEDYKVLVNGEEAPYAVEKGYAYILIDAESEINVSFLAPARWIYANPSVRADVGKVALQRGPLVYCLEEKDNGENLSSLYVDTTKAIEEMPSANWKGIVELKVSGKRVETESWDKAKLYSTHKPKMVDTTLQAIPYPYWNNRGVGEMLVWMKTFN